MRRIALLLSLPLVIALGARADDWNKTYAISQHAQMGFRGDDANVHVTACDCKQVTARVATVGWRLAPDEVRITEQQTGDTVNLELRVPHDMHWWGMTHRSIDVDLRVPRTSDLNLRTGDGHIDVMGVAGELRLQSGDGRITGTDLEGKLYASTGDGRITVSGRFDLLDLNSGDGRIEADVRSGSKPAMGWRVHTGDGSITLRLPADFSAELDAQTGDGRIQVDLPVTTSGSFSRNRVHGKLNQGGPPLNVTSGDGSIRLERAGASL